MIDKHIIKLILYGIASFPFIFLSFVFVAAVILHPINDKEESKTIFILCLILTLAVELMLLAEAL